MDHLQPSWAQWKAWLADIPLPVAVVYLPALDENIHRLRATAEQAGKPLRVASKSVRSVALLRRIIDQGAGEVQTPLRRVACRDDLHLGDPILFRHAKAGELGERFNELLLVDETGVVGRALTYRGEGWVFF